jgi:hypothetical protein
MDRRAFIGRVAGGVLAAPLAARAQKSASPVIGYLGNGKPGAVPGQQREAFRLSLRALGWIEGPRHDDRVSLGGRES